MAGNVCDVCGGETVGVAGSAVGACSFAYCAACLNAGLEPYDAIVDLAFCIGGLDNAMPEYQPMIDASLAKAGKTRAEAEAASAKAQADYEKEAGRGQG